jgi:hypothetical protein
MKHAKHACLLLVIAWALASPRPARAEDPPCNPGASPEAQEKARVLADEGYELVVQLRHAEAGEKYAEAARSWNRADIHNLAGVAFLNALRLLDAYEHVSEAVRCGRGLLDDEELQEAQNRLQRLQRRLTDLEVRVDEPGARVLLNKQLWFTGAGTQKRTLVAGQYIVTVEKPGYVAVLEPVVLDEGKRVIFQPTLMTERDGIIVHRRFRRWLPWTIAGAGAVMAGTGLGLRVSATGRNNDYDRALRERCAQGCLLTDLSDLEGQRARARTENVVGLGMLGAGAAALTAGLALAFINQPEISTHPDAGKAKIDVIPLIAPHSAGVSAGGRF